MKNNDELNKNLEKLISLHGQEQKMEDEQKNRILDKLTNKETQIPGKSYFNIWRKIAIAASIVLVPAVIAIYLLVSSGQRIKIPPELASMSAEELVKLNYDSSQTSFDPNIVQYALKQALEKATPEEVIIIAKSQKKGRGVSFDMAYPPAHPVGDSVGHPIKNFRDVVEESNLFIHAKLLDFDLNVEDIIEALVEKEKLEFLEDFMGRYKVTLKFYIIDCLPDNKLKKGKTITFPTILYEDQLNAIKKNSDYYLAMVQKNNNPQLLDHISGFYTVDFNNPVNIEAWQFFKDTQDILLWERSPEQSTIDYWISKLNEDTYSLALEYMDILPDEFIPSESIMDFFESRYSDYLLQADKAFNEAVKNPENNQFLIQRAVDRTKPDLQFLEKVINLVIRSKNMESIKRMLRLIEEDMEYQGKSVVRSNNKLHPFVIRLVIASNEDDLSERLIEKYFEYKDKLFILEDNGNEQQTDTQRRRKASSDRGFALEIINQALKLPLKVNQSFLLRILNDPSELGLDRPDIFREICKLLGTSDDFDIRQYLEDFLASPDLSDIGVELGPDSYTSLFDFETAAFEVLQSLPNNKRPSRKELLNYLIQIYERNGGDSRHYINSKLKTILRPEDSEILPVLEGFLSMDYKPNTANGTEGIIIDIMHDPSLIPYIRVAMDKIPNDSDKIPLLMALYACGEKEEVISKALEMLDMSLNKDEAFGFFQDAYRNSQLLLFLGKTNRDYLIPYIEEFVQTGYPEKYVNASAGFNDILVDSSKSELKQNAILAYTRLAGKDAIPKLRQVYKTTDDIRAKVTCAFGLYYNGDKTGEKLLRHLIEGTFLNLPEIQRRWRLDISEGDLFQNIIKSYLRNELTDALWLEKLTYYVDRADEDIESDFFKDHKREILDIMVEQLDNKNKETRGYACEILRKATGQNFGFDNNRYAGQQEEIIQRWREYLNSIEE